MCAQDTPTAAGRRKARVRKEAEVMMALGTQGPHTKDNILHEVAGSYPHDNDNVCGTHPIKKYFTSSFFRHYNTNSYFQH